MADKRPETSPEVRLLPADTRPGPAGGRLRSGNPGNVGRSANRIRLKCAEDFERARPRLLRIALGIPDPARKGEEPPSYADSIQAARLLGQFGLDNRLQGVDVAVVRDKLAATLELFREMLPPDTAQALVDRMKTIWAGAAA